jgi:DNA-binding beta-propeller fold protein YncE
MIGLLAACYSPKIADCRITCGVGGACPSGLSCVDGFCRIGGASGSCSIGRPDGSSASDASTFPDASVNAAPGFPLVLVQDIDLPGTASRFDYQGIDLAQGILIIAHVADDAAVVVDLNARSVKRVLSISGARGVAVGGDVHRIFVTSAPSQLVIIDDASLTETARVPTGHSPDGDAWDPTDQIVATADQADGAVSLIPQAGTGTRTQVRLGVEPGNIVFDDSRKQFWAAVVTSTPPDQLVSIDPRSAQVVARFDLVGCAHAHGVQLDPSGARAFVACDVNSTLVQVDLDATHPVVTATTGMSPDVLSLDPGLGLLYVAAESGDLRVFDVRSGLVPVDAEHIGSVAHSVLVDPATHHVFFPLQSGPNGTPVLRIMKPSGL